MECCTYLRNIQDLLSDGKTPYERRFGDFFFKDQSFRLVHWLSITQFLHNLPATPTSPHQKERKNSESGTQWKVSVRMQMLEHNLDGDMMDPDAFLHVHDVCFDRHSPGNKTFLRHLHIAHGRGLLWRRRFHVTCLTQVVNMHIGTLTRTDRQNLVVAVPPEALASTFQPMQSSAPQILCSGPYTCRKTCRLWPRRESTSTFT